MENVTVGVKKINYCLLTTSKELTWCKIVTTIRNFICDYIVWYQGIRIIPTEAMIPCTIQGICNIKIQEVEDEVLWFFCMSNMCMNCEGDASDLSMYVGYFGSHKRINISGRRGMSLYWKLFVSPWRKDVGKYHEKIFLMSK